MLNALAQRDVAIVAETAGTTRDVIEVQLDLGGYPVTLVDTAGLRDELAAGGVGIVEAEGMRRARLRAASADLKLVVADLREWPGLNAGVEALIDDFLAAVDECTQSMGNGDFDTDDDVDLTDFAKFQICFGQVGTGDCAAGNMTGFVTEAYKRGKINFPIDYNQPERIAELLNLIGHGEGIGKLLGSGIKQVAAELGLEDLAVHVKGLEPAGFDPRVLKGMGLSYATAARGACHLRGTFYKAELSGEIPKDQIEGKEELQILDIAELLDSVL